ncbi:hypothetical protein AB0M79_13930 [Polymorphospora sp. NPDC051019]|uniref:hypothetical protein n=1 Tax=Polymorphospora sp. NPDC051019 TaxID=3155725 RepID=UPI003431FB97
MNHLWPHLDGGAGSCFPPEPEGCLGREPRRHPIPGGAPPVLAVAAVVGANCA